MRIKVINASLNENKIPQKRVCAYARVSTNSEEQLLSLENQTSSYERLIKSNPEYEFIEIYHDRGMTGSKEERTGFQKMISDAKAGKIDLIMVKSISRFARDTATVLKYSRELKESGVGILFEEENINTLSKDGELMLSVLSSFAQEELLSMSENLKWSVTKKYENGISDITYREMYGYTVTENRELAVNEEQAEVVRRIFNMYIGGFGMEKIAKLLNEDDIPTLKGKRWLVRTVSDVLKNEKYKGDCRLHKYFCPAPKKRRRNRGEVDSYYIEDDHFPIVPKEIWDRAQEVMEERRRERNIEKSHKYQNRYPLSGMLICPYCGSKLRRKQVHNKRIEWWCSKYIKEGVKSCKGIHVRDEDAMAQNITEPTIVREEIINGTKYYSYSGKSKHNNIRRSQPEPKKVENGGVLQSKHRQRRAIIKL